MKKPVHRKQPSRLTPRELTDVQGGTVLGGGHKVWQDDWLAPVHVDGGITAEDDWETPVA